MAYTVAMREKGRGKSKTWLYAHTDLHVRDTTTGCKPLTREQAEQAKQRLLDGAKRAGRPIVCRVVRLADDSEAKGGASREDDSSGAPSCDPDGRWRDNLGESPDY